LGEGNLDMKGEIIRGRWERLEADAKRAWEVGVSS